MTESPAPELRVAEWLRRTAPRRAPEGVLQAILDRTSRVRPRSRWQAMLAEPQMRREATVLVGSPRARRVAVVAGLAILALVAALAIAGAALLRSPLGEAPRHLYAANPDSLGPEVCSEGRNCRDPLASWPGGRFLVLEVGAAPPRVLVEAPWPGTIIEHALGPSGSHLAYVRTQRGYPATCLQLLVVEVETGAERLVAEVMGEWAGRPLAWWPDGRHVAFANGGRCSAAGSGVFAYDLDTGLVDHLLDLEVVVPTLGPPPGFAPADVRALHPDGRRVLLSPRGSPRAGPDALVVDVDRAGDLPAELSCGCSVAAAAWSPDGGRLLVETPTGELLVATGDGTGFRVLADLATGAAWAPDGASIAYLGGRPAQGFGRDSLDVIVVAVEGGPPVRVATARFPYPALGTSPRWTPDGARIYWSDVSGTWSIRPDGSDLQKLPLPPRIDLHWGVAPPTIR